MRRNFILNVPGFAAAIALVALFALETVYSQPGLRSLANLVALDFVSTDSSRGRIRYSYLAALNQAKRLLGRHGYIPLPRLLLEFGPNVFSEEKFKKEVMVKYPEYGLVAGGLLSFASHGAGVMACHTRFAKTLGYASLPEAIPIQDGLKIIDLHYHDNLNNPAVLMKIDIEPLIARLQQFPDHPILNMSMQVGTVALIHKRRNVYTVYDPTYEQRQAALLTYHQEQSPATGHARYHFYDPVFYRYQAVEGHGQVVSKATGEAIPVGTDGYAIVAESELDQFVVERKRTLLEQSLVLNELDISPFYEIRGAYTGEFGTENIQELFRLVNSFPTKLFIVAAGNYGDDLRPLRQQFAEQWPENLLVVGYWDESKQYPRMFETYDIFGADLYFDGTRYSPHTGSSMATAVISAAASILSALGYPLADIKPILLGFCDEVEIKTKPYIPIGSTNIADYINAELQRTTETVRIFNESRFRESLVWSVP